MEKIKATVTNTDEKHYISIEFESETLDIPMSENLPDKVKAVFNKLIVHLKEGLFEVELYDLQDDLFSLVAKEYIKQLNQDIQEVHSEMKEYNLTTFSD